MELGSLLSRLIFLSSSFSPSSLDAVWVLDESELKTKPPCIGGMEGDGESWKSLPCRCSVKVVCVSYDE